MKACLIQRHTERKRMWEKGNYPHVEKHTYHYLLFCILRESSGISDWSFSLQPRIWILATVMVFQKYEFPGRPETTDSIEQALNDTLCSSGASRSEFSDYVSVLEASLMFKTGEMDWRAACLPPVQCCVGCEAVRRSQGGCWCRPSGTHSGGWCQKQTPWEWNCLLWSHCCHDSSTPVPVVPEDTHNRYQKSNHSHLILFLTIRAFQVLQWLYFVIFQVKEQYKCLWI